MKPIRIRLALFEDGDRTGLLPDERRWIVRSLDHETFGFGFTQRQALEGALLAIRAELDRADLHKREPFDGVPPASHAFIAWWHSASDVPVDIPKDSILRTLGDLASRAQIEMTMHPRGTLALQPRYIGVRSE